MKEEMKIVLEGGIFPSYATEGSAGYDLFCPEDVEIPQGRSIVKLKIKVAIPEGYFGFITARSGFSAKGFSDGNEVFEGRYDCDVIDGKVDADYRGEVGVIVNNRDRVFTLRKGTRIAQMIIIPYIRPRLVRTHSLEDTERGEGGFGHSGVK